MDVSAVSNVGAFKLQPDDLTSVNAEQALFGSDGFSFGDILDVVNPLQQLPIVGSIYREATGSGIGAFARLLGGFLFGGPVGLALAGANVAIEAATGTDATGIAMSMLNGETQAKSETAAAFNLAAGKYQAAASL